MRFLISLRALLRDWLLSFLGWGLVAVLMSAQNDLPWRGNLQPSLRDWLPWAVLTPLIFRLVFRFPLQRQGWKVAVPVQLAGCLCAVALTVWWRAWMGFGGGPPMRNAPGGPPPGMRGPGGPPPDWPRDFGERPPPTPGDFRGPPLRFPPGGPPPRGRWDSLHLLTLPLPIYLALASAAHALLFYRREQERAAGLAQARLEALRMQLQPHFLFNALNAIAELMHRDVDAAERMLTNLSDLLRLTLETSGEHELPLRRELQFVESYLAVEHARFGERLRFEFDVADDTLAALVPAFVLQPLVENAVRHGLAPRTEPGLIVVAARRQGATLHLSVSDDGVGLPAEQPAREGIGLANTRARLRELYGSAARLELRSAQGVTVDLHLPFRPAP